jgi:hypothetical protein
VALAFSAVMSNGHSDISHCNFASSTSAIESENSVVNTDQDRSHHEKGTERNVGSIDKVRDNCGRGLRNSRFQAPLSGTIVFWDAKRRPNVRKAMPAEPVRHPFWQNCR